MTVFVAGVHGVGKSYFCREYANHFSVVHESASSLIRKERAHADWSADKKVSDIDENQVALQRAVQRITKTGESLLLDGHFVLINEQSEFVPIDISVFRCLDLSGVVLLEARSELVASRLKDRDSESSAVDVDLFIKAERVHAKKVCEDLGLTLHILDEPKFADFSKVVESFFSRCPR